MKLRLGAAVLLAAIVPLSALTTPSPARAGGVDITPPEVGSCHDLTYGEALKDSDPDPAVPCTQHHTTLTTQVVTFDEPVDWSDTDAILAEMLTQCTSADLALFEGYVKSFQLSTYTSLYFFPTRVQQEEGANWARCDVALYGYHSLKPLPTNGEPALRRRPPLTDAVARCRKGKADDYNVTSCDRAHKYHSVYAYKYPSDAYPGQKRMIRWTIKRCARRLGSSFGYYEYATKERWRVGLTYSICYRTTSR